ncbi:MAG: site-specific DNA-methyltransferase [Sulfobacillus thermosulfidooxidans]|uniref:Site-specific DNA-methyltransferase n=1 Tax=Sulfobacillus thermosulfidooxidans TaxID=28034 RepID=A0A2T2WRK2_SULTH|nr:MAG: site-specific DNA-methyltransferase [Sulfobacillus thermosulfidooxidans]
MPRSKNPVRSETRQIKSYEHAVAQRLNNPPVGLVTPRTDPVLEKRKSYAYDPHLDPQLEWAGKTEHTSFDVPTVSLHVHERIDARTIIEAVRKQNDNEKSQQLTFFEAERKEPLRDAIDFYKHSHGWSNRLIAGDSLLVMNSLLEKEGMAGKVQMIYIDPPYGIGYGSNFQPFVNKRDVKDGKDEDLTAEPEQIRAFRDTWELGIHSYLTYLRDRLLLARELLHESGSIFVQISDENVHHVRELLDEVFGAKNFVSQIYFATTSGFATSSLSRIGDYLIWYAKDKAKLKYRQLYTEKSNLKTGDDAYKYVELADGMRRPMTQGERQGGVPVPEASQIYRLGDLQSQGEASQDTPFIFEGCVYRPNYGSHWKPTYPKGLTRLHNARRIDIAGTKLGYVRFASDFPVIPIKNVWLDTGFAGFATDKRYIVETNVKVVARCILMTTDPGDLVLDPTCGSGTTAFAAETWGRRWITCDTSRVALTLARQRLMTAVFDYYELAHPDEGVGSGFKYKTVQHISLESIAKNSEIDHVYARLHSQVESSLTKLNAALQGQNVRFRVERGGRSGHFVEFFAPDSRTFTLPSGQIVKANELLEWEVPFEFPLDWPQEVRPLFDEFHVARRAVQKAINEVIIRYAPQETLYDQPILDRKKMRVTGPFTVEAVPSPVVRSVDEILNPIPVPADLSLARSGETLRQAEWRDELLKTGIRGKNGQFIRFSRLEPLSGCRWLHGDGEVLQNEVDTDSIYASHPMRVVVSFGPEHGPIEPRHVAQTIEEAQTLVPKPALIIFAAFQFDPEAAKDIDETQWPGVTLLKVQMNADLLTEDLKKQRISNESFWLVGQPDVGLERIHGDENAGQWRVIVRGFDYYNPSTGAIESGGADKIAVWMLDTDYDGRSLYPRQVFFPVAGDKDGWAKLAKTLRAEVDSQRIKAYQGTVSLPFEPGDYRRIAVKIVDDRGIESLKVVNIS